MANPGGGLFGSTTGKSLFGANSNNTTGNNLFGQGTTSSPTTTAAGQGTSLFANNGNTSGNAFGSSSAGFNFGTKPETSSQPQTGSLFGSLGTPNKPDQQAPAQQGGIFGQASTTPNKPLFNTANTSTTPAGPPPSNAPGGLFGGGGASNGASLFGNQNRPAEGQNQSSNSLFSAQPKSSNGQQQPQAGGMFAAQSNKPAENQNQAPSTSLFGSASGKASPSLFSPPTGNGLFPPSGPKAGTASQDVQPNTSGGTSSPAIPSANKPTLSFPQASNSGTSTPSLFAPAGKSGAPSAPSLFSKPAGQDGGSSTPQSQAPSTSGQQPSTSQVPAQSNSLFSQKPATSSAPGSQAPSSSGDLFPNFKKPTSNDTPVSSVEGTSKTPATSTNAAPSFSLSTAPSTTQGDKPATSGAPTAGPPALGSSTNAGGAPLLSNSTSGPTPSAQSRLKNKTMDDIITRWSSDLLKYQKDFQSQAEKVAQWDRQLVENTNAISKLYSKTYQAERDTSEIQKQLSAVEGNQDELTQWLDRYEQEVDDMIARQVGQGDGMQGPDQERERTYRTAERVSERLGEMGKDLTSMIEEINHASSSINKSAKSDDPLSQIVRVLNGHLAQLQIIDQGTTELQGKIADAQNQSKRLSSRGRSGLGYDAADDFGRTFRSRG